MYGAPDGGQWARMTRIHRKAVGITVTWLAVVTVAVGLWLLIGDGTCITACQTTTEWVVLGGGIVGLVVSTLLQPGAALVIAIPAIAIVLLGKAALGQSVGTWTVVVGVVMAVLSVAGVFAARWGVRRMEEEHLKGRGTRAHAVVLDVREVRGGDAMRPMADLHVLVRPPDEQATFEVTVRRGVSRLTPPRPGDLLPVWMDPDHRSRVMLTVPGADDYPAATDLEAFGITPPEGGRGTSR